MDKIEFYPDLARVCAAEPSRKVVADHSKIMLVRGKQLSIIIVRCNGRIVADCLTDAGTAEELAAETQLLLDLTMTRFAEVW